MKLSKTEIIDLLSNYFPNLKEDEIELFLSITEYHIVKNKRNILKNGKTDKYVILILKGAARAYRVNNEGKELNNYIRAEGKLIADARVFGDDTQILNVESIGEIHFLKFDISELENLGFENSMLMVFYLNFLKEIILTLAHRVNTFVSMSTKERYLDLIKWNPHYLEKTYDKHIASFLGITPLTLHRIKKDEKAIK